MYNHPSALNTRPEQKPEQSNRSTTRGGISWKKALAISALPLALLFGAAFQGSNSVPAQLEAIQAQLSALQAQVTSLNSKGPRKFYLSKTLSDNGAHALSACAIGYHMASLAEIHDTSNLRYDTALGLTTDDSGSGPPSLPGSIRTGGGPIPYSNPGFANCNSWTSADGGDFGTIVTLAPPIGWNDPPLFASPWQSGVLPCGEPSHVWCVQD